MTYLLDGAISACIIAIGVGSDGAITLGNQHQSKLTVQTEITSKSVAVLAFESSSLTAELKLESRLVCWSGR